MAIINTVVMNKMLVGSIIIGMHISVLDKFIISHSIKILEVENMMNIIQILESTDKYNRICVVIKAMMKIIKWIYGTTNHCFN